MSSDWCEVYVWGVILVLIVLAHGVCAYYAACGLEQFRNDLWRLKHD